VETNEIVKKDRRRIAVYLDDETILLLRRERADRGKPVGHIIEDLIKSSKLKRPKR
jgi:hypothetical protein